MSHDAFLQAIIETPDDDAPRLVYADWLEDNGDPLRAQFIRRDCLVPPGIDEEEPAYHEHWARVRVLEALHGTTWQPEIPVGDRVERCAGFRRGFVALLQRSSEEFFEWPDVYDDVSPIEGLCVEDVEEGGHEEEFAEQEYFARLRWLSATLGPYGVTKLAKSRHLGRIEELTLEANELDDRAVEALARAELPRLRTLDLSFNKYLTAGGISKLLDSKRLPSLRSLDLAYVRLDADNAQRIASRPGMAKMTSLTLQGSELGDDGAIQVLRSKHLGSLRDACFSCCKVGDATVAALAAGGHALPGLTSLSLYTGQVGPEGARALARAPVFAKLRSLHLGINRLGTDGALALATSETMTNLVCLRLASNAIGDNGAIALAAWPGLREVRCLDVQDNGLTPRGVRALVNSPHLKNLCDLTLGHNPIGDEGAAALADSGLPGRLRELDLDECGIGKAGARALAKAAWSDELAFLTMHKNPLDDDAGRELARSTALPRGDAFRLGVVTPDAFRKSVMQALKKRYGAGLC
jgi:uncharacterized protein (TIGR02996 family)